MSEEAAAPVSGGMPKMIWQMDDPNRYLYHYTSAETALDFILKDRRLRLGRYTATDDPTESKAWKFGKVASNQAVLDEYRDDLSPWLSNEIQAKTRLVCFCMDSPELTGEHVSDIAKRGFCKPRMWTQYARSHTGLCLVFDWQKLHAVFHEQFAGRDISGPVGYIDRGILRRMDEQEHVINLDHLKKFGREAYARDHRFTHHKRLFFEKMTDWRDESEFRCVVFDGGEAELYLPLEGTLAGIMFGERTPVAQIKTVLATTKGWGLEYGGLEWKNSSPWYDLFRYLPGIENTPMGKRMWEK